MGGFKDLFALVLHWWSSGEVVVPEVPGLEWIMPTNRMDWNMPTNRMEWTMPAEDD